MATTRCPDEAELARFAAGDSPLAAWERVARHVEDCAACDAALEACDRGDPLLTRLREAVPGQAVAEVPPSLVTAARGARSADAASAWPAAELPRRLGSFELLEELGSGSFGCVYRARDTELDRQVAIKVLRAGRLSGREDVDRFQREARSAAQLKHPGIVLLYGTGETEDGACYLVEEYIAGQTLADRLGGGPWPVRQAAELIAQVADALDYAHRHGVVHRDVKPSNVMLDGEGRPHLMDFGLAKRDLEDSPATPDGQVLGTPAYMAPEQARGDAPQIDGRSDVYSLGVVLYELLSGERPFHGNRRMLLLQVLEDEPRPPRRLNDRVPRDLETICLKAMSKSPARRYATAGELADDLRRHLAGEAVRARPVGAAERLWRWCRRNPVAAGLLSAVTLGSAVGLWQLTRLSGELVRRSALDSAAMQADMLEQFNTEYSDKVVDLLGRQGIAARHDYAAHPLSLPLPATFLTELGERISAGASGVRVRHYNEAPFRFRKGGPRDEFGREALRALSANPGEPFYRFEDFAGRPVLRYATARRMEASCVDCHNKHPDSTKRDWKVGDVGALEIIRPLDQDVARTREGLRETFVWMGGIAGSLLAMSVLVLAVGGKRRV